MKSIRWFVAGFVVMMLFGWVIFPAILYTHEEQPLQFSHKVHSGETVGLPCQDCHRLSADGRFEGVPAIAKCAECHAEAIGSTADERLLVEEYVKKGREIPWLVYARGPQNASFPHASHLIGAGLACERCHGSQGTAESLPAFRRNRISGESQAIWGTSIAGFKMAEWDGMKMDDCARCHRERGVANTCLKCHK